MADIPTPAKLINLRYSLDRANVGKWFLTVQYNLDTSPTVLTTTITSQNVSVNPSTALTNLATAQNVTFY